MAKKKVTKKKKKSTGVVKTGRKKGSTQKRAEEITAFVYELWFEKGFPKNKIREACAEEYGIRWNMSDKYLKKVKDIGRVNADIEIEDVVNQVAERLRQIIYGEFGTVNARDVITAIHEYCRIFGLHKPTEIRADVTEHKKIVTKIVEKTRGDKESKEHLMQLLNRTSILADLEKGNLN